MFKFSTIRRFRVSTFRRRKDNYKYAPHQHGGGLELADGAPSVRWLEDSLFAGISKELDRWG